MKSQFTRRLPVAALAGLALLAACADQDAIVQPAPTPGGDLMARYVALGQSNTAGYQSGGINDSTQRESYAFLLAQQAGVPFLYPALMLPGCPPPLTGPQPLTTARVGGANVTGATCALRAQPRGAVQNLAVPASRIVDWTNNALADTRSNALTTLILGGRTQLQAMRDANPTLVSVFPEGNELLAAATAGDPTQITPQAQFEAALDLIVAAIREEGAEAILFGVPNVPQVTPALLPGAYYFLLQAAGQSPKPVSATCAPGTPGGSHLVSFGLLTAAQPTTISCNEADPGVLSTAEIATVNARVTAFNTAVQARATANNWIYVDPMPIINTQMLANPDRIRKCQGLPAALMTGNQAQIQQAVTNTCPGPTAPNFWGSYMSFDPIHFSRRAHQVFANEMATAINARHQLSIPTRAVN
jgi:hypothetical protein